MAYLIGAGLAVVVGVLVAWTGMDRDRALYPAALMVIACLYDLFAVIGADLRVLGPELLGTVLFVGVAVLGFRTSLWWVAAGLVAHGVFDIFHPMLIANPGAPVWWPAFCMTYDVAAGVWLAWRLIGRTGPHAAYAAA